MVDPSPRARTLSERLLITLLAIALTVLAGFLGGCSRSNAGDRQQAGAGGRGGRNAGGAQGRPLPVGIVPVQTQDVPVIIEGLGTITAYNTVAVKSRVDGQIVKVNFREGQEVRPGELLVQIDPRPFEVQLHQAEANLGKDQAALADAQTNLRRYEALYNEKVIALQQLQTQQTQVQQLQGAIGADNAVVESAKLNLTYSRVTAPIAGRAGLRMVDVGNVVHASDANGLLVITQTHPIAVVFTLPEDNIPQIVARLRSGTLPVDAYDRDDKTKLASGRLETIDNQIDPNTGTVRLKAVFDNKQGLLWPNQFVNVHVQTNTLRDAAVLPAAAVQHGQQGTFVYVVDPANKAQMRPIELKLTQGDLAVVAAGVQPGDRVVTDGQDRLQSGMAVEVAGPQNRAGRNQNAGAANPGRGPSQNSGGTTTEAAPSQAPVTAGDGQRRGHRGGPPAVGPGAH